jgi:D-glucuronyl C5-epimerase-like protein
MRAGIALLGALIALAVAAQGSAAAPVLVLDGRHVERRDDPYLPATDLPPPPAPAPSARRNRGKLNAAQSKRTVRGELARLLAEGQIDQAEHDARRAAYNRVRKAYKKLTGARKAALGGALENAELIAANGELTPSRLAPLFLTLERNRQWWTAGSLLSNGQRVSFSGSQLVFQNYTGQGIQLQVLGSFGKANGLWSAGEDEDLRSLLEELVPLAADRGGILTWEYYFRFGGGSPPWASGMAQGTAVQALGRAAERLAEPAYRDSASRALGLFETPPPVGVRADDAAGPHYLLYSFDPDMRVINGFLQAVIGLHDFAKASGDARAQALFEQGDAEARREVPLFDTGVWSLYSLDRESDLGYHRLVRDFLERLCERTSADVYCATAQRFTDYLDVPPAVRPLTKKVRAGVDSRLRFSLTKISRVRIEVADGQRVVAVRSATVGRGKRFLVWRPSTGGEFELRVSATDLAGNESEERSIPLEVLPPKPKRVPKGTR